MKISGTGEVFLADHAQEIHLIRLADERSRSTARTCSPSTRGSSGTSGRWRASPACSPAACSTSSCRGSGWVALLSDGPPLLLQVDEAPTFADPRRRSHGRAAVTTSVKTDMSMKTLIGRGSGRVDPARFRRNRLALDPAVGGRARRRPDREPRTRRRPRRPLRRLARVAGPVPPAGARRRARGRNRVIRWGLYNRVDVASADRAAVVGGLPVLDADARGAARGDRGRPGSIPDAHRSCARSMTTRTPRPSGSSARPTIRIDGEDILPPGEEEAAGLTCRIYRLRDGRVSPTPDPDDLRDALARAAEPAHEPRRSATGRRPSRLPRHGRAPSTRSRTARVPPR